MKSLAERSARLLLLGFLTVATAGMLALTGCGVGAAAVDAPQDTVITGLSGTLHGGNNPVTGASLTLYATTSAGYGGNATVLGTTTTGTNGGFAFGTTTTCTANQYAYILATGGNPGLTSGFLSAINVTTAGAGYNHVPNVVITPTSGGSGATATATVSGGAVTGVTINTAGSGYTSAPTISFTPTGGDTITTTAVANATTPSNNAAMVMAAALGPCAQVGTNTTVDINEITTVAFAYALSGFLPAGGAGITNAGVLGGTSIPGVGTSSTNTQGLTDAFNNSANLVANGNTSPITISGTPNTTASLSGGNGTVPVTTINSLADILQGCVNSTGPSSTQCSSLFTDATPPSATNIAAPVNTLQAVIDIAQYPGNNVANLFNNDMVPSTSGAAFQPQLGSAPNDWTIGINYVSSLLIAPSGLGIGPDDSVYASGTGYLLKYTAQGSGGTNLAASPVTSTDTLRNIAFDKNGNLFVTDGIQPGGGTYGGIYEYNGSAFTTLTYGSAPASDTNTNSYAVAVDGKNDVWTQSYSKKSCAAGTATACALIEYPATATAANAYQSGSSAYTAYTPFGSFPNSAVSTLYSAQQPTGALGGARGIAFDVNTGNVWITAIDDNLGELFKVTPGTSGVATASAAPMQLTGLGTEVTSPSNNNGYGTYSVAVDKNSQAWFVTAGGPSASGSHATAAISSQLTPVSSAGVVGTGITGGGFSTNGVANYIVIDGNNNLFISSVGTAATSSVIEYDPNGTTAVGFLSPNIGFNPGATYSAGSLTGGLMYEPTYIAIDRAGALWAESNVSSGTASNLVQILGVAAPTDPVLANGKYGIKP